MWQNLFKRKWRGIFKLCQPSFWPIVFVLLLMDLAWTGIVGQKAWIWCGNENSGSKECRGVDWRRNRPMPRHWGEERGHKEEWGRHWKWHCKSIRDKEHLGELTWPRTLLEWENSKATNKQNGLNNGEIGEHWPEQQHSQSAFGPPSSLNAFGHPILCYFQSIMPIDYDYFGVEGQNKVGNGEGHNKLRASKRVKWIRPICREAKAQWGTRDWGKVPMKGTIEFAHWKVHLEGRKWGQMPKWPKGKWTHSDGCTNSGHTKDGKWPQI